MRGLGFVFFLKPDGLHWALLEMQNLFSLISAFIKLKHNTGPLRIPFIKLNYCLCRGHLKEAKTVHVLTNHFRKLNYNTI